MTAILDFLRTVILFLLSFFPSFAQADVPAKYPLPHAAVGEIAYVIDGDTFAVASKTWPGIYQRIRVHNIDTPEKVRFAKCAQEAARGQEATDYAKEVLHVGSIVTLKNMSGDIHSMTEDNHRERITADVYLRDGTDYGKLIVSAGLARPWIYPNPKPNWCR